MYSNYWEKDDVKLRALEDSDLEYFISLRNNPDSYSEYLLSNISFPKSIKNCEDDFAKLLEKYSTGDKNFFIISDLNNKIAGFIVVYETIKTHNTFRYSMYIDKNFQNKKIASSALIIVLDYYFNQLNYNKIINLVYEFNLISASFHKNFGFTAEGLLRDEIYSRGKYHNIFYFAMTKLEFNKKYQHFTIEEQ